MILDVMFAISAAILMVVWIVQVVFFEGRPSRHDRCLKNIARLERELGIGPQPVMQGAEFFELKPGAHWPVDELPTSVNFVQVQRKVEWLHD